MKQLLDALQVLEKLREVSGAASVREEFVARGGVNWTLHEDVFDCLYGLAALASDLV
jgi:hypothetical protein